MNPETALVWASIATGVLSIGGIITKEAFQMLRSKREGVTGGDVKSTPSNRPPEDTVEVDLSVVTNLTKVIRSMESQIDRLSKKQDASDERIVRIEKEIETERNLKWIAIQHLRTLYAWIARQRFGADVPDVPEELAPHVVVPGKDKS